jgi:succinate dehydrogenase / fumarate reductase membrane anchor subunit
MTDMKTPLAKVRGLGSAKDGTHHWWMQRVTAVANLPLVIFMVVSFVGNAGKDHAAWTAWLAQPLVSVLVILFVANFCYHMRLGLQVIVEDYVHDHGAKIATMLAITFATVLVAALCIFSVLRIAFGG